MKKVLNYYLVVFIATLLISSLGACEKGNNSSTQASVSGTKTATTAKTTVKSVQKSETANNITNKKSETEEHISQSNFTGQSNSSSSEEIDNTVTEEEIDKTVTEEEIDLNGRNITISYAKNFIEWELFNGQGYSLRDAVKEIEQRYNCKFVWDTSSGSATQHFTQLKIKLFAGTETNDIVCARDDLVFPWAVGGALLAFEDILKPSDWDLVKELVGPYSQWINGKHYGMWNEDTVQLHSSTVYNPGILEREGIPDIRFYYMANNNWNWNTFLEIAKKTTKDINGDGIIDQWGIATSSGNALALQLIYSNNGKFVNFDYEKGKVELRINSRPTINALQFFSDLYNIHKVVTNKLSDANNGNVAMVLTNPYTNELTKASPGLNPNNADLALLPIGPDAQDYSFGELSTCRFFSVPSTTENPRDVVLAFAAALSKYREAFKDESIAYNKGVGRAMTIPGVNREKNIDFYGLYDFNTEMEVVYNREAMFSKISSLRSSLVSKILALTSVSTAIAEVEPEMQNHIDSIMASW